VAETPRERPTPPDENRLPPGEPLPPPPRLGPDSTLTDLLPPKPRVLAAIAAIGGGPAVTRADDVPEPRIVLEKAADGRRRLLFAAEVCLREGPLEVFVCKKRTKEHEAILRIDADARFLHAGLIAVGGRPGTPVQFVNPKTMQPEYRPATGSKVEVGLSYRKDGKVHTHPAREWVRDVRTRKPMAHGWVFAGSRFMEIPDRPDEPPYYMANAGDVIGISNSFDAMLDIPVEVSRDDASLAFEANTDRIPPLLSKVWVTLEVK
jgi:hypothetical protein